MKNFEHELVMCIVNEGFSEAVMDAARAVGATGGTVISAHGTANKAAEKFFSINIQPEKEIVMIIVPKNLRDDVMHALYKSVGLSTAGHGIAFSVPIDNAVGLTDKKIDDKICADKINSENDEIVPESEQPSKTDNV